MRRAALFVLVVVLLVGAAGAFVVTGAVKLERSPVRARNFTASFSPNCACPNRKAVLSFQLRRRDRLDLVIVADGKSVRTLARDVPRRRGRVRVRWDGRNDAGRVVPDGRYRLRVHLRRADRTIVFPIDIEVTSGAPEPTSARARVDV